MNRFNLFVCSIFLFMTINWVYANETYGPIQSGEMLWDIASKIRPNQDVSRHQVIIALQKANPHAFRIPCNINSLKIKQVLNVPNLTAIQALTHKEAIAEYSRQNDQWKAYRGRRNEIQCPDIEKNKVNIAENSKSSTSSETTSEQTNLSPTPPALPSVVPQEIIYKSDKPENPPVKEPKNSESPAPIKEASWTTAFLSYFDNMAISNDIVFTIIGTVLILTFIIGWLLHRHASSKSRELTIDELPLPLVMRPSPTSSSISTTQNISSQQSNVMAQHLVKIRDYMSADDILSISPQIDGLLQEVLEKGTAEQQQEARQLLGIKKKLMP